MGLAHRSALRAVETRPSVPAPETLLRAIAAGDNTAIAALQRGDERTTVWAAAANPGRHGHRRSSLVESVRRGEASRGRF